VILLGAVFINIGFGGVVAKQRVIAVIAPDSSPVRRLREAAREEGRLVDASHGRRTRAIIVTDSNHVVLSAVGTETIAQRLNDDFPEEKES
jgi:regulator of extracellular matrix RemA (YlzA/DUF370 family)